MYVLFHNTNVRMLVVQLFFLLLIFFIMCWYYNNLPIKIKIQSHYNDHNNVDKYDSHNRVFCNNYFNIFTVYCNVTSCSLYIIVLGSSYITNSSSSIPKIIPKIALTYSRNHFLKYKLLTILILQLNIILLCVILVLIP